MHTTTLAAAFYALLTSVTAYGSSKPVCATKCWTNSQYVSPNCGDDIQCLCDDSEFQSAVYQCLYSQCQTAHFGSALHHTLTMCHDHQAQMQAEKQLKQKQNQKEIIQPTIPALIRNQIALEKRQNQPMASMSNSASRSRPMMSVSRSVTHSRPMMSVSRSVTHSRPRPTMSVSNSAYRGGSSSRAMPMVTQIADGQVQAPTALPMSMFMSEMSSMGKPVSQIADGQIQAPVSQISDGQIQAPTPSATPAVQIADGQPQVSARSFMDRLLGQL